MAELMVSSGRSPLPTAPQRLVVVFQPHRYSRTQEFLNEFAKALSSAHTVLLAPIYSAGEAPIAGINSHTLGDTLQRLAPDRNVVVADTMDQLTALVQEHSKPDDLVLAMGAGDVNSLWSRLSPAEDSKTSNPASTLAA
jgi:UDP-N-acetylmuramate--alanine ligase